MDLRWPWVALALGVLVIVLLAWWARPPRAAADAVLVAHTHRLRGLPRFRALARRRLLLTGWHTLALLVLAAGTILLVGREQVVEARPPEGESRDIIICLDASSSMSLENAGVVEAVRSVVSDLRGERIGLTIFSSTAITVFPLTDDYAFVARELARAQQAFAKDDFGYVAGTTLPDGTASLMSDGLVSCVHRFDAPAEERGRAIILASDNEPQGPPLYTFEEAARYAAERDIVVYGLAPGELARSEERYAEFAAGVDRTGGSLVLIDESRPGTEIVDGVEALRRTRLEAEQRAVRVDDPDLGTVVTGAGMLLLVLGWVAEAVLGRRRRQ